jgi:hypothetical protein
MALVLRLDRGHGSGGLTYCISAPLNKRFNQVSPHAYSLGALIIVLILLRILYGLLSMSSQSLKNADPNHGKYCHRQQRG